jgi:hypothetical protein
VYVHENLPLKPVGVSGQQVRLLLADGLDLPPSHAGDVVKNNNIE